jgi:hypothetical protein
MGRHLLEKRRAYRQKRTDKGRLQKRKYRKNNICTCARSSCCFPASTTSESCEINTEQSAPSESSLNTCINTEAEGVVNQVYAPEKKSVAHKNKVLHTIPSKKNQIKSSAVVNISMTHYIFDFKNTSYCGREQKKYNHKHFGKTYYCRL